MKEREREREERKEFGYASERIDYYYQFPFLYRLK